MSPLSVVRVYIYIHTVNIHLLVLSHTPQTKPSSPSKLLDISIVSLSATFLSSLHLNQCHPLPLPPKPTTLKLYAVAVFSLAPYITMCLLLRYNPDMLAFNFSMNLSGVHFFLFHQVPLIYSSSYDIAFFGIEKL